MSKADIMRAYALSKVGLPYQWAEEFDHNVGPTQTAREDGDCSGLVYAAYTEAKILIKGRPLTRETADTYFRKATRITQPSRVGDMGFLLRSNGESYHTFLYVGRGQVVEAGDGTGHVGLRTVAQENARGAVWGRFPGNDIGELEDEMDQATFDKMADDWAKRNVLAVWPPDLKESIEGCAEIGLLETRHKGTAAVSVNLFRVVLWRLAKKAGLT